MDEPKDLPEQIDQTLVEALEELKKTGTVVEIDLGDGKMFVHKDDLAKYDLTPEQMKALQDSDEHFELTPEQRAKALAMIKSRREAMSKEMNEDGPQMEMLMRTPTDPDVLNAVRADFVSAMGDDTAIYPTLVLYVLDTEKVLANGAPSTLEEDGSFIITDDQLKKLFVVPAHEGFLTSLLFAVINNSFCDELVHEIADVVSRHHALYHDEDGQHRE